MNGLSDPGRTDYRTTVLLCRATDHEVLKQPNTVILGMMRQCKFSIGTPGEWHGL